MRTLPLVIQNEVQGTTKVFTTFDPYTGQKSAEVCFAEPMHIVQSIQGLKKGQADWAALTPTEKADVFEIWAGLLQEHMTEWSLVEAQDLGLSQKFVAEQAFVPVIELLRTTAQELKSTRAQVIPPLAPMAIITAWPLSFRLAMERLVPALASGHTVILNISPLAPGTYQIFHHLFSANAAASKSVQLLTCSQEAFPILINHPAIKSISFVGSEKTFSRFAEPQTLLNKKLQLSFGTKNSAIILPGTDLNNFAMILESFLRGQGQLCWNTTRLFTLESMRDDVFRILKQTIESLTPAKSANDDSLLTPIINAEKRSEFFKHREQVVREGKILAGGDQHGNIILPLFTQDLPNCSELQQDDLGLPLFFVTTVKYQHEIAKWANNTPYAQLATIWGEESKARKVAEQLDTPMIQWNHWTTRIPPGTGAKGSAAGNSDFHWQGSFFSTAKLFKAIN